MYLRNLCENDLDGMYEWMHDLNVIQWFSFDGMKMTENDVRSFIERNKDLQTDTKHYAIVKEGEYAGTLSLKNIDTKNMHAEMAISVRTCFQGSGLAEKAVRELFQLALDELGLHKIYLNVMANNGRAKKFYEKVGFEMVGKSKEHLCKDDCFIDLDWYEILLEGK